MRVSVQFMPGFAAEVVSAAPSTSLVMNFHHLTCLQKKYDHMIVWQVGSKCKLFVNILFVQGDVICFGEGQ